MVHKNKGKQISAIKKPLDNPQHCLLQIEWVISKYGILTNPFLPVCYIDEKWFYKVNRHRKLKVFPKGVEESEDVDQARK